MSTIATVAVATSYGFRSISVNFDGYLDGVGKVLAKHYADPADDAKRDQLMQLGNLSVLGAEIGAKQEFYKPTNGS